MGSKECQSCGRKRLSIISNRWAVLALVSLGIVISYVDRGNLSIAAPSLMGEFGISPQSMGLLLSAFFWTYGAFQIPSGFIIDRFGIRRAYCLAFLIWSLSSAGMALARGTTDMIGLRLLLGIAESVGPLASLTFIRLAFSEQERGLPVSIYIAGQTIGPACGALVGTILLAAAGWRTMFAVTGLCALVWLPFWLRFAHFETKREPHPAPSETTESNWNWREIISSRAFWAMSFCVFLFSYYWYFLLTWVPTYLNMSRGLSTVAMGRVVSIPLLIMAPVNILAGRLADRVASRRSKALQVRIAVSSGGFLGASSIFLLSHVTGYREVLLVLTLSTCFFGIGSTNFWATVQHLAPPALTARTVAYFNTVSQVAGVVAPILTGYTLGPARNFSLAISLAAFCVMMAAMLLLIAGMRGIARLSQIHYA